MRIIRPVMLVFVLAAVIATAGLLTMEARQIVMHGHGDPVWRHMHDVTLALDMFRVDIGRYPTQQEGLSVLVQNPGTLGNWHGPYLKAAGVPLDPWGQPYQYHIPGQNGNDYDLFTTNGNAVASQ